MPKVLTFENIGLKGLNTDLTPWSMPPDFFSEGKNFRVFANQVNSSGGSEDWSTAPVQYYPGYLQHAEGIDSPYWLVPGRDAVYTFDGLNWVDISSVAGYGPIAPDQELNWTGCQMGNFVVLNNPQIFPEYWSQLSPSTVLQPLPWVAGTSTWQSVNQQAKVLRTHNQWMWAMNLFDNGTEIKDGVRWSHPAEINGLPPSWDETDRDFLAGKVALGGDSGRVIDGRSLRNSFVVYSENAINIFDESSEFIWRRREQSATAGLLSDKCLIDIKGRHYFLSQSDCLVNNGTEIASIMHNRLRKRLISRINNDAYFRSFVVRNNAFKEIWFCVPEDGAEFPTTAYVYNWRDDSWAIRDLPLIANGNYGSVLGAQTTWETWTGTWDSQRGFWGAQQVSPLSDTVVGVDRDNFKLVIIDAINDPTPYEFLIERTNFPLEGHPKVTTITRVYPHAEGTQEITFELGSHDFAGSPIRWKPAVTFKPNEQRKIDIRSTGELHAWRFRAQGSGSLNLSGVTFEYEDAGAR